MVGHGGEVCADARKEDRPFGSERLRGGVGKQWFFTLRPHCAGKAGKGGPGDLLPATNARVGAVGDDCPGSVGDNPTVERAIEEDEGPWMPDRPVVSCERE